MSGAVHHGDCLNVMRSLAESSVDAIVTDPPYGLGFMGKEWDALPPGLPWAQECLRVLKPGGHLLAFGGTRTFHRLAVAVEDAGFELRDSIAWMHGQGFPKGKQQLKPAFEPIIMGRKRGGATLNVDACRIGEPDGFGGGRKASSGFVDGYEGDGFVASTQGRWPANVVLDESQAAALDEQSGTLTSGVLAAHHQRAPKDAGILGAYGSAPGQRGYGDKGGASRFFYVAKATKRERPVVDGVAHPTVKPLTLMRWLVRLVTPPGGLVLDPFAGSGTTLEACLLEGFRCVGIEREASYLPLIEARIARATEAVA